MGKNIVLVIILCVAICGCMWNQTSVNEVTSTEDIYRNEIVDIPYNIVTERLKRAEAFCSHFSEFVYLPADREIMIKVAEAYAGGKNNFYALIIVKELSSDSVNITSWTRTMGSNMPEVIDSYYSVIQGNSMCPAG